jgi:hypothetical protein
MGSREQHGEQARPPASGWPATLVVQVTLPVALLTPAASAIELHWVDQWR